MENHEDRRAIQNGRVNDLSIGLKHQPGMDKPASEQGTDVLPLKPLVLKALPISTRSCAHFLVLLL